MIVIVMIGCSKSESDPNDPGQNPNPKPKSLVFKLDVNNLSRPDTFEVYGWIVVGGQGLHIGSYYHVKDPFNVVIDDPYFLNEIYGKSGFMASTVSFIRDDIYYPGEVSPDTVYFSCAKDTVWFHIDISWDGP